MSIKWEDVPDHHLIEIGFSLKGMDQCSIFLVKVGDDRYREVEYTWNGERTPRDSSDTWLGKWSSLDQNYMIFADHGYLEQPIFRLLDELNES